MLYRMPYSMVTLVQGTSRNHSAPRRGFNTDSVHLTSHQHLGRDSPVASFGPGTSDFGVFVVFCHVQPLLFEGVHLTFCRLLLSASVVVQQALAVQIDISLYKRVEWGIKMQQYLQIESAPDILPRPMPQLLPRTAPGRSADGARLRTSRSLLNLMPLFVMIFETKYFVAGKSNPPKDVLNVCRKRMPEQQQMMTPTSTYFLFSISGIKRGADFRRSTRAHTYAIPARTTRGHIFSPRTGKPDLQIWRSNACQILMAQNHMAASTRAAGAGKRPTNGGTYIRIVRFSFPPPPPPPERGPDRQHQSPRLSALWIVKYQH